MRHGIGVFIYREITLFLSSSCCCHRKDAFCLSLSFFFLYFLLSFLSQISHPALFTRVLAPFYCCSPLLAVPSLHSFLTFLTLHRPLRHHTTTTAQQRARFYNSSSQTTHAERGARLNNKWPVSLLFAESVWVFTSCCLVGDVFPPTAAAVTRFRPPHGLKASRGVLFSAKASHHQGKKETPPLRTFSFIFFFCVEWFCSSQIKSTFFFESWLRAKSVLVRRSVTSPFSTLI